VYQCTKFDEYIFIYDRDVAKNPNSRWLPPPSWVSAPLQRFVTLAPSINVMTYLLTYFTKSAIFSYSNDPRIAKPISISVLHLTKICTANANCKLNLQTKFGANRSRHCWDVPAPVYVFRRWRPSAIL